MAHRQKNLLEAFNASAAVEKDASADPDVAAAGGPFAPDSPRAVERAIDPEDASEKPGLSETLLQPENRGGLLILLALGLTLAFLAGRASKGEVVAAGEDGPAAQEPARASVPLVVPVAAVEAEPNEPEAVPASDAERALVDPSNRFTIKLCEYQVDQDEDFAWANYHYLEDLGLPAAMLQRGKRLFIVVGAAPKQADLDDLLARAKSMAGPPPRSKKAEFSDAYVVMIDSVLDR